MGLANEQRKDYSQALECYYESLDIFGELRGGDSIECANILNCIGIALKDQEDYLNAFDSFQRSLKVYSALSPDSL